MPLSLLTRLRGVIIVAAFAFALLWLEISDQMLAGVIALFLMPLLFWLLVSNAVKDAPPFDDTAFHRTRPVTAGKAYRHLVGFHLLVLACILLLVLAYVWRFNLGWREALSGSIAVVIPLIALVSLFGATASLWTSSKHWKGWPFVLLLLLPAISLLLFCSSMVREPRSIPVATLTFAGALIYPALWWLVAARRRWFLGSVLGLLVGILMPWISLPIGDPYEWFSHPVQERTPVPERTPALAIRRLKTPANTETMVNDQAAISRSMEILGLGPDEFVRVSRMGISSLNSQGRPSSFSTASAVGDMPNTNFCTTKDGELIPATVSLLRAIGNETVTMPWWDSYPEQHRRHTLEDLLRLPTRTFSMARNENRPPSPEMETFEWSISGESFRWLKILDVAATKGGRAKFPDTGTIRILPLEETSGDFTLTMQMTGSNWIDLAVVAKTPDGKARLIDLQASGTPRQGFLTSETEFEFRNQTDKSPGAERRKILRDSRIEVYRAESRGTFSAILPPPK